MTDYMDILLNIYIITDEEARIYCLSVKNNF